VEQGHCHGTVVPCSGDRGCASNRANFARPADRALPCGYCPVTAVLEVDLGRSGPASCGPYHRLHCGPRQARRSPEFSRRCVGDEPALAPHEGFYQRVLAGDATEAALQAESQLATKPLSDYYDAVPMRALAFAHADAARGKLPEEKQLDLLDVISDVIEDLEDYADLKAGKELQPGRPQAAKVEASSAKVAPSKSESPILLLAARTPVDQAASLLFADVLKKRGLEAPVQPYSRRPGPVSTPRSRPKIVCVSCFGGSEAGSSSVRLLIKRYRRVFADSRFVACFWHLNSDPAKMEELRK
jgi:hypothetical protein